MIEHSSQGLEIGFPHLMVSFFFSLGANTRPQSSVLISNLGETEKSFFFPISALTPSVKSPWG
jgi:hypothetical protein